MKWIGFLIVSAFSLDVLALSPLQYCERLHARRPANVANSFELLNVEVPTATSTVIPAPMMNGSSNGQPTLLRTTTTLKKCCVNGAFKFSILSVVNDGNNTTMTCEGPACTLHGGGQTCDENQVCIPVPISYTSACG